MPSCMGGECLPRTEPLPQPKMYGNRSYIDDSGPDRMVILQTILYNSK